MLKEHSSTQDPLPCPAWGLSPAQLRLPRFPSAHISPASRCRACRIWTLPSPPSGLGPEHDGTGRVPASSLRLLGLRVKLPREKLMPRAQGGHTVQPVHPSPGRILCPQEHRALSHLLFSAGSARIPDHTRDLGRGLCFGFTLFHTIWIFHNKHVLNGYFLIII